MAMAPGMAAGASAPGTALEAIVCTFPCASAQCSACPMRNHTYLSVRPEHASQLPPRTLATPMRAAAADWHAGPRTRSRRRPTTTQRRRRPRRRTRRCCRARSTATAPASRTGRGPSAGGMPARMAGASGTAPTGATAAGSRGRRSRRRRRGGGSARRRSLTRSRGWCALPMRWQKGQGCMLPATLRRAAQTVCESVP